LAGGNECKTPVNDSHAADSTFWHNASGRNHHMRINELKQFVDTTVTLRMRDGEIAKVKVNFVDEEYENIVALVVETSCPEHHRAPCAMYTFAAEDIASVELSP
jgi:hypothetical protein